MYQKCFNHLVSIYVGGGLVIFHRVKNIAINKIVLFLLIFAPVNSGLFLFSNNTCVSAANDYETPILLAGKEDIILYKKDIIISTDDLKNIKKNVKNNKMPLSEKKTAFNIGMIDEYLKEGKNYELRNHLSEFFLNKKIPEKQHEIKALLDKLNSELIFSAKPSEDAVLYTVQAGETLSRIAKQFNTNYELIMRINKKPDSRLNIGEKLKILKGKTKILISKSEFTLTVLLNDRYVKQYRIGTGKNDKTPEGTFEVKNKMKNPTWYSPYGGVYSYGDEKNILGTRWIGFKEKENLVGFGIHGTTMPETIGTASSDGCIRMKNSDVEEVFDFVTTDTGIIIQR
ncbi:MAG: hypothetical protein A2W17_01120 [Planctomycetes bacterium RBG_16_41_13]|nr:MAG: hypothetical protein A2W17_01120 [Planctomycetes bacterium RBG_16_41_13]